MTLSRRRFLPLVAALAAAPRVVPAQSWPNRPIRILVPAPPGSGPDVDLRRLSQALASGLGQPVVIENRPGAGTRIAAEAVARSAPDGYTFLLGTPSIATMSVLYERLPFNPNKDLVPVSLLSTTAYSLTINAAIPARSLADYIALVRNAASNRAATLGAGTLPHLAGAWFASMAAARLDYVHYATQPPYPDLLAGHVDAMFEAVLPLHQHVRAGKLRTLAISGAERASLLPEVPTFAEAGLPDFNALAWVGLMAPAGTPAEIIDRMSAAVTQVARTPEIVQFRRELGSVSRGGTPAEFATFIEGQRKQWGALAQQMGLKLG